MEMEIRDFHDNRFQSIQALRGICALFIVLEHVRFLNCGAFGVDVFFCISGFMIMFSTHKSAEHFLRRRLARIVPLYYLMTLGTWLLLLLFPSMFEQTQADPVFLIKSLLFIPFDIGDGVLQPLMRVGWTINCEIFFYLLFFAALRISHRYRGLICSVMLGGVVLAAQLLSGTAAGDWAPLRFYGDYVMLEFVLGIVCYYAAWGIYETFRRGRLPRFLHALCLLLSFCILAALALTKHAVNILEYRRLFLWGIPAMLLVLCVFTAGLTIRMPALCVRLGDMSFSLYLVHYYPVMFLDRRVFDFSACTPFSVFGVIISVALCLLLAWICWYFLERKPATKTRIIGK